MLGASRTSLAAVREALVARLADPAAAGLPDELFAVADLLDRERALRARLADPGADPAMKASVAGELLEGRVSPLTVAQVQDVVRTRWSQDRDLVDALETLAVEAAFAGSEQSGTLDEVEEELFRFGRTVDASPELQMLLTDPGRPASTKAAVIAQLLEGRAEPVTRQVVEHTVTHLRGRRVDEAFGWLSGLAAERRGRLVAEVRVARPLSAVQDQRLTEILTRLYGRPVETTVAVDPEVLGGVEVRVGGEVIDGTIAQRLSQARQDVIG